MCRSHKRKHMFRDRCMRRGAAPPLGEAPAAYAHTHSAALCHAVPCIEPKLHVTQCGPLLVSRAYIHIACVNTGGHRTTAVDLTFSAVWCSAATECAQFVSEHPADWMPFALSWSRLVCAPSCFCATFCSVLRGSFAARVYCTLIA